MSAEVCSLHRRRLNSKGYYYPLHPVSWQACCSKAAAGIFSLKGRLFLAFSLVWLSAAQQCQMASCFLQNLWAGYKLHMVYRAPWRVDHSTAPMPEGPGSCCGISEDVGSVHPDQQGGWQDPFSVMAILSQRKTKKEGSSERQQRTPTLRDPHNIGPCLSELGMTDNNSNSLH